MMRTFLFGISAAAALALAAGGAQAKAPQCRDAKGRIVVCPEKKTAPAPAPSGGAACLWLLVNGSPVPCYAI